MSKYYSNILLSILLLAALITGCSSSTEGVETHEKQSANLEEMNAERSSEGTDTNVDSEKTIEDLREESDEKFVFSNFRAPGHKPIPTPGLIPTPGHKPPCRPPTVSNSNGFVTFYVKADDSYSLHFNATGSVYTNGTIRVEKDRYLYGAPIYTEIIEKAYTTYDKDIQIDSGIDEMYDGVHYNITLKVEYSDQPEVLDIDCS